jgi:hypothetical protein
MIVGIHGYLGSFKTTIGVALAELAQESGYVVMSNQPLNREYFPDWVRLDMDMLRRYTLTGQELPYKKLFILGDEWQQVMDSRRSMGDDELLNSYLIMQTRKRGMFLCYITSLRGMNDIRLRDNTNIIIKTYKRHRIGGNICYDDYCTRPHYADMYVINKEAGKGNHKYLKNPEIIFPMFDTSHIISPISHLSERDMKEIMDVINKAGKV